MVEKLSSGHLYTRNTAFSSIFKEATFCGNVFTHKILIEAALERFGSISAC